jgi:hypothetical protein
VGPVVALGVDETSFLKANREHPIIYATGLVDLNAKWSSTWSRAMPPRPAQMVRKYRRGLAEGREGCRHRSGGVLPGRAQSASRSRGARADPFTSSESPTGVSTS